MIGRTRIAGGVLLLLLFASCTYTPRCEPPPSNGLSDPVGLALSPDGKFLYVTNANASLKYCSGHISRIYLGDNTYNISMVFPLSGEEGASFLGGMVFSQDGTLFAASREKNEILVLTPDEEGVSLAARIPVGEDPYALALFSSSSQLLVTNIRSNDVSVVDVLGIKETKRIPLTRGIEGYSHPSGIAVNPRTPYAYVTQQASSYVSVIDLSYLCERNPQDPPSASQVFFNDSSPASNPTMSSIALSPCGVETELWSVEFTTGTGTEAYYMVTGKVSGLQPSAFTGEPYKSSTGGISFTIFEGVAAVTPGDSFTFYTYRGSGVLSSIGNADEYFTRGIAVLPDGLTAAIANRGMRSLLLADLQTNSIEDAVFVCNAPEGVAAHPDGKRIYVTCPSASVLYQVNGVTHRVEGILPTENGPSAIVVSPDGTRAYIANYSARSISILDTEEFIIIGRVP